MVRAGAALASTATITSRGSAAQFEFKCASNNAREHPASIRLVQMWDAVEKETGGRVHTQFFPDSQLGGDAAMFSQLRLGALAFFFIGAGTLATVVPSADIGYLGFAFKDPPEGIRVMDGPLGDFIRQEATAKNVHLLRKVWDLGMLQINSNLRPVRTPEDLRGFRIRVTASRITVDLFKTLGASPASLPFNELYTALQTHVVDGGSLDLVTTETAKLYEVQNYASLTAHQWAGNRVIANGDIWKSMPADIQDIIERNNAKFALLESRDIKLQNASLADKLTRQGLTVNKVNQADFRGPLRPYYESWAKEFGTTEWGLLQDGLGRKLS